MPEVDPLEKKIMEHHTTLYHPVSGVVTRIDRLETKIDTTIGLMKWLVALAVPSAISLITIGVTLFTYLLG